jgi:hypothetical protein
MINLGLREASESAGYGASAQDRGVSFLRRRGRVGTPWPTPGQRYAALCPGRSDGRLVDGSVPRDRREASCRACGTCASMRR